MINKCAECGCFDFEENIEPDEFQRNGQTFTVDIEYSVCRQCGYEVIFTEQIKRNDCRILETLQKNSKTSCV